VADTGNHTIRKVTPAGVVSTLAGSAGLSGFNFTDVTGAAARISSPDGVATDSAGNVYVADTNNSIIRKITPADVVSTLAGGPGVEGSTDGTGIAARFRSPRGVATDSAGNVYVADTRNNAIRKITPAGVVTKLAGSGSPGSTDGTGSAGFFNLPRGIATDSAGNIYVADTDNSTIRKITPAGEVSTLAGTAGVAGSTDATGAAARFNFPRGVAADSAGNLYVADTNNHTIRKITPAGAVTTLAGTAGVSGSTDATGAAARFNFPFGVATDSAGNIYVADFGNNAIRKITPAGVVSTLAGASGGPHDLATDSAGNVYVADTNNSIILKITPAGVVTTFAGSGAVGSSDGTGTAASFAFPFNVATDSAGNVYVSDVLFNDTIRKITPAGLVTTLAGTAGVPGSTDGTGAAASFRSPRGIAADSAGNVYVADRDNSTIRKITPAGVVSTVVGGVGQASFAPGALPGLLAFPYGLAIIGNSLYITLYNGVAVVTNVP
jgi:sugar lactone lactonase YvrE